MRQDELLGGKVRIWQPIDGYRAGTDPVLLAASISAAAGQKVLELGCGAAPALCCLGVRVPDVELTGVELQPAYAELARRNLECNGLDGQIWTADLRDLPLQLRSQSFDHVFANPPYFEGGKRVGVRDPGRELALAGDTPLAEWLAIAARRLKPRGYATFIQRAERLPDMLHAMQLHFGSIELWPLVPRQGRAPRLILLRGRKEGRAAFQFHAPQILHAAAHHRDGPDDYVPEIMAVMRDGAALPFPHGKA